MQAADPVMFFEIQRLADAVCRLIPCNPCFSEKRSIATLTLITGLSAGKASAGDPIRMVSVPYALSVQIEDEGGARICTRLTQSTELLRSSPSPPQNLSDLTEYVNGVGRKESH